MNSNLYFFDQKLLGRHKKRLKKTPEELPQSLRFAHLNPRIAAFLRQQEKARVRGGEGGDHTPKEGEGVIDGVNVINLRDLKGGIGKAEGLYLPDIKDGNFSLPLLKSGYFDSNSNDGEEFTQRHLYQEANFTAPMLLTHLARILYLFHNEHLDLPRELVNLLLSSWQELISEAQYVTREWQSQAYQEKAMNKLEEEEREKEREKEQKERENKEAENEEADKKKKRKKKEEGEEGRDGKKGAVDAVDGVAAASNHRRESKAASIVNAPQKTKPRLERQKSISMHKVDVCKYSI